MLLKIVRIGLSRLAVRLHYSFADYECHSLGPVLFSFMIIDAFSKKFQDGVVGQVAAVSGVNNTQTP